MNIQNSSDRSMTAREMVYNILVDLIDTETLVVISLLVLALYMLSKVTAGGEAIELMKYFGAPIGLIVGAFAGFVKGLKKSVRVDKQNGGMQGTKKIET
jgi:hypothetical protein